jgi:hypothetical protein
MHRGVFCLLQPLYHGYQYPVEDLCPGLGLIRSKGRFQFRLHEELFNSDRFRVLVNLFPSTATNLTMNTVGSSVVQAVA